MNDDRRIGQRRTDMPIEPKRIEAAARALSPSQWDRLRPDEKQAWLELTAVQLAAAYPELASDPPTAWVAPIDTNAEALQERLDQLHERMARQFGLMADAYTKEQT